MSPAYDLPSNLIPRKEEDYSDEDDEQDLNQTIDHNKNHPNYPLSNFVEKKPKILRNSTDRAGESEKNLSYSNGQPKIAKKQPIKDSSNSRIRQRSRSREKEKRIVENENFGARMKKTGESGILSRTSKTLLTAVITEQEVDGSWKPENSLIARIGAQRDIFQKVAKLAKTENKVAIMTLMVLAWLRINADKSSLSMIMKKAYRFLRKTKIEDSLEIVKKIQSFFE